MDQQADQTALMELTAEIVSAYVGKNSIQRADLPALIDEVHKALSAAAAPASSKPASDQRKLTPQDVRRSIKPDAIVSFEDGKSYKTMRRHLSIRGLTPQAYREKWGLPADYPMVAPSYSTQRSELARSLGLGRKRREELAVVPAPDAVETPVGDTGQPASRTTRDDTPKRAASRARKRTEAPTAA